MSFRGQGIVNSIYNQDRPATLLLRPSTNILSYINNHKTNKRNEPNRCINRNQATLKKEKFFVT